MPNKGCRWAGADHTEMTTSSLSPPSQHTNMLCTYTHTQHTHTRTNTHTHTHHTCAFYKMPGGGGCYPGSHGEKTELLVTLSFAVQLPSCIQLFATPWTAALQASLSLTISRNFPEGMSTELVIPPYHLTLCCPLLLLLLRDPPCGFRNGGKEAEGGGELRAANGQGESQQGCHTLAVGPFSVPAEPYITVPPQRRGLSPLRCHFLCGVSLESLGVLSFHPLKNWQSSWALFWDCHVHLGLRDILSVVSTCVD